MTRDYPGAILHYQRLYCDDLLRILWKLHIVLFLPGIAVLRPGYSRRRKILRVVVLFLESENNWGVVFANGRGLKVNIGIKYIEQDLP